MRTIKSIFFKLISTNSQVIHFHKRKNRQSSNELYKLIIEFILLKQWNEQYALKNVHHSLSHILCFKIWACNLYMWAKGKHLNCINVSIPKFKVPTHWHIERTFKTMSIKMIYWNKNIELWDALTTIINLDCILPTTKVNSP